MAEKVWRWKGSLASWTGGLFQQVRFLREKSPTFRTDAPALTPSSQPEATILQISNKPLFQCRFFNIPAVVSIGSEIVSASVLPLSVYLTVFKLFAHPQWFPIQYVFPLMVLKCRRERRDESCNPEDHQALWWGGRSPNIALQSQVWRRATKTSLSASPGSAERTRHRWPSWTHLRATGLAGI